MLNLAKYAAVAALAVCLGVAATKPASAWGYSCGDGCGCGYGAFGSFSYGFYPYGYDDYRLVYRHHYDGFYGPARFYRHWR
jgi:hypothetical protein